MDIYNPKNRREMRRLIYAAFVFFVVVCFFGFIEGMLLTDDIETAAKLLISGILVMSGIMLFYAFYPHPVYFPLFMGISTLAVFIGFSFLTERLDYYFFIMLLIVILLSTQKNFNVLFMYLIIALIIDIILLVVVAPRVEWMDTYRFFNHFMMYVYGSFFILIQTRNVVNKQSHADKSRIAFYSLLESTPNFILITDPLNCVKYISAPMLRFAGKERLDFAIGRPLVDLFADKELKLMFADILDKDGFYESVVKIHVKDEERHFIVVSDQLMGEERGRFIDITDITPTVMSRLAAEEAKIKAELANSAKSKFLATMSHEIRTPMNAILGIAEIEIARENNLPETRDALQMLYNSGHSLLGIINDILDLSKIDTGNFALHPIQYDTPSLIHDTVQLNIMRIGSKPITFMLKISENLPCELFGDELRVKQVLNNLLSNAIKYTAEGSITFEADSRNEGDMVRLIFTVRDTGQGMNRQQVDLLLQFEDYSRFNMESNRMTEGTGLGISITKNLVDMMGGVLHVESEPGVGSVFTVELIQKGVDDSTIGRELADNLQNFRFTGVVKNRSRQFTREYMPYGRVLIVDDVETNLYVAKGLLTPYGLTVDLVSSGFDAVDKAEAGEIYDIVFMDHMMPKMDGIEAALKMREAGFTYPIVALTANAVAGQAEIFFENGFDDFISKPIDVRLLDEILKKFIRDKQSRAVVDAARRLATPEIDAELLTIFTRDVKKTLPVIESVYATINDATDEDIVLYTVGVHAMKSALAHIGEADASRMAYVLEKAGKEQDRDSIRSGTPPLLDAIRHIISKIKQDENKRNDAKVVEDIPFLLACLIYIIEACARYDERGADTVLMELKEKPWMTETKDVIEKIAQLVLHSDFEEAGAEAGRFYAVVNERTKIVK